MQNLVGRYTLKSHGTFDQNRNFQKTSEFLKGELIYSSDSSLSVIIFFKDTPETNRDFLAYSGSFELINDFTIVHKISICSNPNRDRTHEKRTFKISGDQLTLNAELENGKLFEALWQKI